ncbi:MAG: DUF3619 family protein [Burkholderiaceae bacterium]
MNEKQIAYAIRRELDQGATALPEHVTRKLHEARTASLTHLTSNALADPDTPALWFRLAITAVPAMFAVIGLFGIAQWTDGNQSEQFAQELAAVDEAVLLDELPIAAFTDKGFAVFIENTRQ